MLADMPTTTMTDTPVLGTTVITPRQLALGGAITLASAIFSGWLLARRHGGSIGWALGGGALGLLFPVATPGVVMLLNYDDTGRFLGGRGGSRGRRGAARRRRSR